MKPGLLFKSPFSIIIFVLVAKSTLALTLDAVTVHVGKDECTFFTACCFSWGPIRAKSNAHAKKKSFAQRWRTDVGGRRRRNELTRGLFNFANCCTLNPRFFRLFWYDRWIQNWGRTLRLSKKVSFLPTVLGNQTLCIYSHQSKTNSITKSECPFSVPLAFLLLKFGRRRIVVGSPSHKRWGQKRDDCSCRYIPPLSSVLQVPREEDEEEREVRGRRISAWTKASSSYSNVRREKTF